MLQYSIKHKPAASIFMTAMESLRAKRELQQQQSPQQQSRPPMLNGPFIIPVPWSKEQFNRFVSSVCADFEVLDLVCPIHEKEDVRPIPLNVWELAFINEIYKGTMFDSKIEEPIIFTLRNRETGELFNRCPRTVRKLTPEEMNNVNAQNKSADTSFP